MEFLLQQEGSLGTVILLISLLVGLLYLLMPFFIWRIWYWSQQNNKHLKEMSTNLEFLIRDIAPDALPPLQVPEEPKEDIAAAEEKSTSEEGEEDLFSEESFEGDLSDDESMGFSMSDEFDDVSDDLSDSEISDFTDEASDDLSELGLGEDAGEGKEDDDDELVMDFDDESEETADEDEPEDFFSEEEEEEASGDDADLDRDPSGFVLSQEEKPAPSEIPVSDDESSDFTVEHFESNEERSFEFEDVDDEPFSETDDSFPEEKSTTVERPAEEESKDSAWGGSPTDDIWGEGTSPPSEAVAASDTSSSETESDVGSAFDEPAKEDDSVGDVANSFLSDLENKLNLDSFTEEPVAAPEPPPAPAPAPEPQPEPAPAESQATLFARCEGCGHKLAYKQALSGKRVRCPACRTAFALP